MHCTTWYQMWKNGVPMVGYKFWYSFVSVIVLFVTLDCWSLHWGKTLNTVYVSDSIQQERLPVGLEVAKIYF